jgi:hypothetical protein
MAMKIVTTSAPIVGLVTMMRTRHAEQNGGKQTPGTPILHDVLPDLDLNCFDTAYGSPPRVKPHATIPLRGSLGQRFHVAVLPLVQRSAASPRQF